MAKNGIKIEGPKQELKDASLKKIKKVLGEKNACYVLITCTEPSKEGQMEVEMTYEGDETLAAFLIENASQVFDERMAKRESN